jgi:hypothetical protein
MRRYELFRYAKNAVKYTLIAWGIAFFVMFMMPDLMASKEDSRRFANCLGEHTAKVYGLKLRTNLTE